MDKKRGVLKPGYPPIPSRGPVGSTSHGGMVGAGSQYGTHYTQAPHSQMATPGLLQAPGPYVNTVDPYDSIVPTQNQPRPTVSPYVQIQPRRSGPPKKTATAYKMGILGFFGLHHFYLERPKFGVLYLFTGGLLLIGWLIDICRMPMLVKQANDMIDNPEKYKNTRTTMDAYILWFPLGFFGAHHYYLGRMHWGVAYTFTLGLLGVGWAIDGARMKHLVKDTNQKLANPQVVEDDEKKLSECYILAVTPLGLLGAHYYYLERWMFAVMYTFTLGLFGIGWFVDLCTLPYVFKRANRIRRREVDPKRVYLAEAYKLVFPLGFLGLHHFYLRRPGWGVLYMLTFGCLCIGWLIDFFRLPSLVTQTNLEVEREAANLTELENRLHGQQQPPIQLPPAQEPPEYSAGAIPVVYAPHANNMQRNGSTPSSPSAHLNELPPPYTPRETPANQPRNVNKAPARPMPAPSQMDVITEEDEDAASVVSGASRRLSIANDVSLENSLNEQIYEGSKGTSDVQDTAF